MNNFKQSIYFRIEIKLTFNLKDFNILKTERKSHYFQLKIHGYFQNLLENYKIIEYIIKDIKI